MAQAAVRLLGCPLGGGQIALGEGEIRAEFVLFLAQQILVNGAGEMRVEQATALVPEVRDLALQAPSFAAVIAGEQFEGGREVGLERLHAFGVEADGVPVVASDGFLDICGTQVALRT